MQEKNMCSFLTHPHGRFLLYRTKFPVKQKDMCADVACSHVFSLGDGIRYIIMKYDK
jgi:hypothetical protein